MLPLLFSFRSNLQAPSRTGHSIPPQSTSRSESMDTAHAAQPTSAISSRVECQGPLLRTEPLALVSCFPFPRDPLNDSRPFMLPPGGFFPQQYLLPIPSFWYTILDSWISFIISRPTPNTFEISSGDPQTFFDIHGSTIHQTRWQWLHENHCVFFHLGPRTTSRLRQSCPNLQFFRTRFLLIYYTSESRKRPCQLLQCGAPASGTPCIRNTRLYFCPH